MSDRQLGVLLTCFDGVKTSGKARRPIDTKAKSNGDVVLDTTVLQVNAKHEASLHDPRRVVAGTLTPALTWGLFGLVAGGVLSMVIWAVLGAVCGGVYTYYVIHHLGKAELARIGKRLDPDSSALLSFVETSDARRLLATTSAQAPTHASVASIADDLTATVFSGASEPTAVPSARETVAGAREQQTLLNMIMLRYHDPKAAEQVASQIPLTKDPAPGQPEVELVIATDSNGKRHVTDPELGIRATGRSSIVSWAGFGVVCGAIAGFVGGGDLLGLFEGGVETAIGWGIFGFVAGSLYGLWAGRAVTARRLKGIGRLLAPGTSTLLAWADGPLSQSTLDSLSRPDSQQLVLRFNPVQRGALLEAVEPPPASSRPEGARAATQTEDDL